MNHLLIAAALLLALLFWKFISKQDFTSFHQYRYCSYRGV